MRDDVALTRRRATSACQRCSIHAPRSSRGTFRSSSRSTRGSRRAGGRCSCTSRSRCAATRAAASATTGRPTVGAKAHELKSFADAARFFNPMIVTFTGGEPTLRRDLEELVARGRPRDRAQVRHADHARRRCSRRSARGRCGTPGINQFNISLDYLDERHDAARGIPGLDGEDLRRASPAMRARGIDNIRFNTVIKNDNLDQLLPIVERARGARLRRELQRLHRLEERQSRRICSRASSIARARRRRSRELLAFKRRQRGVITNSDYYLEQIPRYVRGEMTRAVPVGHSHDPHRSRPAT